MYNKPVERKRMDHASVLYKKVLVKRTCTKVLRRVYGFEGQQDGWSRVTGLLGISGEVILGKQIR